MFFFVWKKTPERGYVVFFLIHYVVINPKYIAEVIKNNESMRIKMQNGAVFYVKDFLKLFKAGIEV